MALMFYMRSSQKPLVFYHRTPVFLPVCNTTADLQKAEQAIADSKLFRQEALLHQCKASAHCPIDFRRLGWVRKSIQPSHGYPESISRDFAGWRLLPA